MDDPKEGQFNCKLSPNSFPGFLTSKHIQDAKKQKQKQKPKYRIFETNTDPVTTETACKQIQESRARRKNFHLAKYRLVCGSLMFKGCENTKKENVGNHSILIMVLPHNNCEISTSTRKSKCEHD